MRTFLTLLVLVLPQFYGSLSHAEVDEELLSRFKSAVSKMSRKRDNSAFHVRSVSTVYRSEASVSAVLEKDYSQAALANLRAKGIDPKKDLMNAVVEWEFAKRDGELLEIGVRPNGTQTVSVTNNDYMFSVSKVPKTTVYSMKWLAKQGQTIDPGIKDALDKKSKTLHGLALSAWAMFGEPLEELVKSDEFEVSAITEISINGKNLVRVDFSRTETEFRPGGTLTEAYLICDPASAWAIAEYGALWHDTKGKPVARKTVFQSIVNVSENTPFVSKIEGITAWLDDSARVDRGETVLELVSTNPDKEMFRLSGYGLPEPKFENRWLTNWSWLMYLIAGIGCLAAAYYWRRRQALTSQVA